MATPRRRRRRKKKPAPVEVPQPHLTGGLPLEEKQRILVRSFLELSDGTGVVPPRLPLPLVNIIADYSKAVTWKFASSAPGLFGPMERLSDSAARHRGPPHAAAFIQGDTPLSFGVHAWRLRIDGLRATGISCFAGIAQAGKQLGGRSYADSSFYGVSTWESSGRYAAGTYYYDTGFERICRGDTLDFLLDVDAGSLTVITLKDNRRCVFTLPTKTAWVPHFWTYEVDNVFSFEILEPEQAGKT